MIWLLKKEDADLIWHDLAPMLEDACQQSNGRHTTDSTRQAVKEGRYDVFIAMVGNALRSVCITTISHYPASKWLTIILCGGEKMLDWLTDGKAVLEDYARLNGCVAMEVFGRPGWCKAMNLIPTGVMMECKL